MFNEACALVRGSAHSCFSQIVEKNSGAHRYRVLTYLPRIERLQVLTLCCQRSGQSLKCEITILRVKPSRYLKLVTGVANIVASGSIIMLIEQLPNGTIRYDADYCS